MQHPSRSASYLLLHAKRNMRICQVTCRRRSLYKPFGVLLALLVVLANIHYKTLTSDSYTNFADQKVVNEYAWITLENESNKQTVSAKKIVRPNIILIVADDLGYNDVSYHVSEINTPNIDILAKTGVRLENYYVQPSSMATVSQLFSGRYQIHTGLQHDIFGPVEPRGLPLDSPTLADKLREAGYRTYMVGRWHLGYFKKEYLPTYRGFDSFYGSLNGLGESDTRQTTFNEWNEYDLMENKKPAYVDKYNGTYSIHLLTRKAVDILNSHNKNESLFLYIYFQSSKAPERYVNPYENNITNIKRREYAGKVSCLDEAIGNITTALKQTRLFENTLLVFTTDNGSKENNGGSNNPLRGWKGKFFEGGIRAVGFLYSKWLQKKMAGTISTDLIHVTDWYPTLVKLAKGRTNGTKPLDGYDQWSVLTNAKPNQRSEILINIDPMSTAGGQPLFENTFDTRICAALRMDDWKLITGYPVDGPRSAKWKETHRDGAENVWLFNIRSDPNETMDLSDRNPDIVRMMLVRLKQYQKSSVPVIVKPLDANADPAEHGGFWGPWL